MFVLSIYLDIFSVVLHTIIYTIIRYIMACLSHLADAFLDWLIFSHGFWGYHLDGTIMERLAFGNAILMNASTRCLQVWHDNSNVMLWENATTYGKSAAVSPSTCETGLAGPSVSVSKSRDN